MQIYFRLPSLTGYAAVRYAKTRQIAVPTLAALSLGIGMPEPALAQAPPPCSGTLNVTCPAGTYTSNINVDGSGSPTLPISITLEPGVIVTSPGGNAVNAANSTGISSSVAPATLTANGATIDNTSAAAVAGDNNTGLRIQSSGNATISASGQIDVRGIASNWAILTFAMPNSIATQANARVTYGSPGAPGLGLSFSGLESGGIQVDNRGVGNATIEASGNVTAPADTRNRGIYGLVAHTGDALLTGVNGAGNATVLYHAGTIDLQGEFPRGILAWVAGPGSGTVTTDLGTRIIIRGTDPGDGSPTLATSPGVTVYLGSTTSGSGQATATVASEIQNSAPAALPPPSIRGPIGIRVVTYADQPIAVTYTGPGITTRGGGGKGIEAVSASGSVTVNVSGPIDTTSGSNAVGILADSGNLLARASGVADGPGAGVLPPTVSPTTTTGAVEVNVKATSVTTSGEFGTGVRATGGSGGVKVGIGPGASVMGGWQADLASVGLLTGLPATGVFLSAAGGGIATLTNDGSIGAWSDRAIAGDPVVVNNGTITGFVQFTGAEDNSITNNGSFNLRHFADTTGLGVRDTVRVAIADFGTGPNNTFTNNGTLVLAPVTGAATLDSAQQYLPLANIGNAMTLNGPLQGHLIGLATFTNSGTIDLQGSPVAGDVLVITGARQAGVAGPGTFISNGGTLKVDTVLNEGGAATRSDTLVVDGTRLGPNGATKLSVRNAGGQGALTANNGILVVEVLDPARSAPGAFTLASRVVAGPYEYQLFRGPVVNSDGNWYLRSQRTPDPIIPPINEAPIPPGASPPPSTVPLYRPEVAAYLANKALAAGLLVHSLHDRLGEPQWTEQQTFDNDNPKRNSLWLRAVGKNISSRSGDGNFEVNSDVGLLQGGGDVAKWSVFRGDDRIHVGGMLGYGWGSSSGFATGNPATADSDLHGVTLGAYGTWFQNDQSRLGWYTDLWAQYGWFSNTVSGQGLPSVDYDSRVLALSAEAGYAWYLHQPYDWVVEPQGQIIYERGSHDGIFEPNGTHVDAQSGSGWISRLGVRMHRTWILDSGTRVQPYVTLNWWHDSVSNAIAFNEVSLRDLYPQDRYEIKLGVDAQGKKGWTGWGNVGWQVGSQSYHAFVGRIGIKRTW